MSSQETHERLHVLDVCAINEVAPLLFDTDKPCVGKLLQVKRQTALADIQLIGNDTGRQPLFTGRDEFTENSQTLHLRQGTKSGDGLRFVHIEMIQGMGVRVPGLKSCG